MLTVNNECITVTVDRVSFQNEETGYSVVQSSSSNYPNGITVVGKFPAINLGEEIRIYGTWASHPQFGEQFQAFEYTVLKRSTVKGIEDYLSSGLIKGIGQSTAKLLVNKFGLETVDIIEDYPERLFECPGIDKDRKERIVSGWVRQCQMRDTIIFLQGHGIAAIYASKLFAKYKNATITKITANPYLLAQEINSISFKKADAIASEFGITTSDPRRIRACILHILYSAFKDGHNFVPLKLLQNKTIEMLNLDDNDNTVKCIRQMVAKKLIIIYKHVEVYLIFLSQVFEAEAKASTLIKQFLLNNNDVDRLLVTKELDIFLKHKDIVLSKNQQKAVKASLEKGFVVVTGGPKTGKKTVLKVMVNIHEKFGRKLLLASPTSINARLMSKNTGRETQTIHSLLEYSHENGGFIKNSNDQLDCNTLIVNEASMIDSVLFYHMLQAVPTTASIIIVGDECQSPSAGSGMVLSELISSKSIPVIRLLETFGQADTSLVVKNANLIKNGKMPILKVPDGELETDCYYVHADEPEKTIKLLKNIVGKSLPSRFSYDPIKDIQILTLMNKGKLGTIHLNSVIQSFFNPPSNNKAEIEHIGRIFRVGDKVIQLNNNYKLEIYNGDIGFITSVSAEDHEVIVKFHEKEILFQDNELLNLAHAYAITVSKSQGSKYRVVVMVISTQHFPMLQRNLLYTGVTRAKERTVILGAERPISIAVKNNKNSRNTVLGYLIDSEIVSLG